MCRLVAAVLLTGVLGSVSAGEPEPGTQTNSDTSIRQTRKSETTQVEKLIADGRRLFEEKDYAAAVEVFTRVVQIDDQSGLAQRERARARMYAVGYEPKVDDPRFTFKVFDEAKNTDKVENTSVSNEQLRPRNPTDQSIPATFARALVDLDAAVRLNESDGEAYKLKGQCLYTLGKFTDALSAFDTAIRLAPRDPESSYARGKVHEFLYNWTHAHADYTSAITLDSAFYEAFVARGTIKGNLRDLAGAMADYDEAVRLDDTNRLAFLGRASVHMVNHDLEKAIADYTKAIEVDPDYTRSYSARGIAYSLLGKEANAIADCSKAIALAPCDSVAYHGRSVVYKGAGHYTKALADIDAGIEFAPWDQELYLFRTRILTKMERPREASESLRQAEWLKQHASLSRDIALRPDDADAFRRRAEHYVQQSRWDRALSDFNNSLQLGPKSEEAMLGRAKAWIKQGEFRKAVADCNRALQHSTRKEIYSVRGDAHFELHEYDRAIADYEQAMSFSSNFAQAYWRRAQERKAAGDEAAAAEDRQRALALDPSLATTR